jgi:hypothetical protein
VSDPKENPEAADTAPEASLDETTPPMGLQQKGLKPSELESLEKTTPEMREFLGSENPSRRHDS